MLLSAFERANQKLDEIPHHSLSKIDKISQLSSRRFNNGYENYALLWVRPIWKKNISLKRLGELSIRNVWLLANPAICFGWLGSITWETFPIPIRKENYLKRASESSSNFISPALSLKQRFNIKNTFIPSWHAQQNQNVMILLVLYGPPVVEQRGYPWKMMIGRLFSVGEAHFQGRTVKFPGSNSSLGAFYTSPVLLYGRLAMHFDSNRTTYSTFFWAISILLFAVVGILVRMGNNPNKTR